MVRDLSVVRDLCEVRDLCVVRDLCMVRDLCDMKYGLAVTCMYDLAVTQVR